MSVLQQQSPQSYTICLLKYTPTFLFSSVMVSTLVGPSDEHFNDSIPDPGVCLSRPICW